MTLNWFDVVLLVILLITLILGLLKGFIRQLVGIGAVVGGLILAVNYYPRVSLFFQEFISKEVVSHLLAFLAVFLGTLGVGGLFAWGVSKLMKGPLKFFNHLFGGLLGLLKGALISGVVVFALMIFPLNPQILKESRIAPCCLKMTKAVVNLIPPELKKKFEDAYYEIMGEREKHGQRF
ncbi:CvpA family protein [bacterium]|nr:CvpA family protein [bacterium]